MSDQEDTNLKLSDQSQITIPLRNLIAIIALVAVSVTGYFGITYRITALEQQAEITNFHVDANSEFRIKWPRGELGSLPDDAEQNMRLNQLEKEIDQLKKEIREGAK